ncbi:UNC5C-like protein [Polyodon spathula]|uniref:UNC5C-like protein n=1 Tax=Polyodon spathula TaxID=7913 RepID=UPI001B7E177A|nr:UNC5C-like protein [Polyodon spathula]
MGISLEIQWSCLGPLGAVSLGRTEWVSLVLVWDLSDSPSLQRSQALLSPVVYCGPHGTSFLRPCLLSFKHCGGNASQVHVYASDTALLPSKRLGEVGAQTKTCITRDECQVALTHFSLYTAVLEVRDSAEAHKWLQLAVFSSPLAAEQTHQQIWVYFLNNTPCALQWASCNEKPFLGRLCGPVQIFDFTSASSDMLLVLKYLSEGWDNVDESVSQSVPFLHIWHGRCPFRSFCFKRKQADCTQDSSEIIVTMHTYQHGQQGKYFEILRSHLSKTGCHVESIAPEPYRNRTPFRWQDAPRAL